MNVWPRSTLRMLIRGQNSRLSGSECHRAIVITAMYRDNKIERTVIEMEWFYLIERLCMTDESYCPIGWTETREGARLIMYALTRHIPDGISPSIHLSFASSVTVHKQNCKREVQWSESSSEWTCFTGSIIPDLSAMLWRRSSIRRLFAIRQRHREIPALPLPCAPSNVRDDARDNWRSATTILQ